MLKKSIILIGMPGCGKTTIGKMLSKKFSCPFHDMDDTIITVTGKSITELFWEGEEVFRNAETNACAELIRRPPCVIACGGGVVKRSKNLEILRRGGIVVFIDRPVEQIAGDIDTTSRPLLKDGVEKLYSLYQQRYSLYKNAADILIDNSGTAGQAAEKIAKQFL